MDSEGYVPLDLVAAFNKLKYLVKDRVLLSEVLKTSTAIEFDAERQLLRRRGDWNQWLLSAVLFLHPLFLSMVLTRRLTYTGWDRYE